jgi:predicted nucleotidyltransferase
MEKLSKEQEIIKILFKEPLENYNSRSISKKVGIGHAGAFKILKKLEQRKIVIGKRIGNAVIYSLNLKDKIAEKEIEIALTLESRNYGRWVEEFSVLKDETDFIILFGSIIRNEKEARDIDVLIVSPKKNLNKIKEKINKKNVILTKPLHALHQTQEDFISDLRNKNKVMLEIIKTGIILQGVENLVKIIQTIG